MEIAHTEFYSNICHSEFYSNICHLVERRTAAYINTMDVSEDEKNILMALLIAEIITGLTALWLSGFVIKAQSDAALDKLTEDLKLLKLINVREIKKNATE